MEDENDMERMREQLAAAIRRIEDLEGMTLGLMQVMQYLTHTHHDQDRLREHWQAAAPGMESIRLNMPWTDRVLDLAAQYERALLPRPPRSPLG